MKDSEFNHGSYNREHIRGRFPCELFLLGLGIILILLAHFEAEECRKLRAEISRNGSLPSPSATNLENQTNRGTEK